MTMDAAKNLLFERLRRNEISTQEYFEMSGELDAYRAKQREAEAMEAIAKDVENKIIKAGGVPQRRDFGEIPNPFAHRFKNLTNQMVVRKSLPELVDFLMVDAGLIAPDDRLQQELKIREQLEQQMRLRQKTEELRQQNDARLGRQAAHPDFAAKIEAYKRAQANSIPYFGGR